MKVCGKDGKPLVEVSSLDLDGDNLVVRSRVANTMNMVIYVKPEDLWESKELVRGKLFAILKLVWKGWRKARRASATARARQSPRKTPA